uniref:Global nitrogen transcriptional regulator n=1 Tax=Yamadaella caenomyce TaxID=259029 RepID=A0A1G4NZ12_9FLOR|nr:Global nitrogen transcriptional regulator [Yamadaella caenomyce]SCW23887.1 Global nitrogen transcriptional regulator [Yamadaella caenomyce]
MSQASYRKQYINQDQSNIYRLNTGDIMINYQTTYNRYVVVEGVLIMYKCFTNGEKFCVGIIGKGYTMFPKKERHQQYYYIYQLEALKLTYILSMSEKKSYSYLCTNQQYKYYYNVVDIIIHKTMRQRIVQLLLTLCELTGVPKQSCKYMLLEIALPLSTIATIVCSHRNTVSKIMIELKNEKRILYTRNYIIVYNTILTTCS